MGRLSAWKFAGGWLRPGMWDEGSTCLRSSTRWTRVEDKGALFRAGLTKKRVLKHPFLLRPSG